ncbi:unnamed protein product [Hapterophycus canaliculatus]
MWQARTARDIVANAHSQGAFPHNDRVDRPTKSFFLVLPGTWEPCDSGALGFVRVRAVLAKKGVVS